MNLATALLVLGQVVCLASGQVLWKWGVEHAGGFMSNGRSLTDSLIQLMLSPAFVAGTVLYALATLIYVYLLSRFDLTYIYPILSLTFVATVAGGWFLLGEPMTLQRVVAVVVIAVGVGLMARS